LKDELALRLCHVNLMLVVWYLGLEPPNLVSTVTNVGSLSPKALVELSSIKFLKVERVHQTMKQSWGICSSTIKICRLPT
jgi:hypothetical protein